MFYSVGGWFLSVVVVGIAINIASNYLFPHFDKLLIKYSDVRLKLSIRRQAELEIEISRMSTDPLYFNWFCTLLTNSLVREYATFLCIAVFAGILLGLINLHGPQTEDKNDLPAIAVGSTTFAFVYLHISYATEYAWRRAILREYWKRKDITVDDL